MDNKEVDIKELNNEELVKLYEDILSHIKFLEDSILEESDGTDNG